MPLIKPGSGQSENRNLYKEGDQYLAGLPVLPQGAEYAQATLKPIAAKHVTSVDEVRTAVEFVVAVNQIAQVAGVSAKELILSGQNVLLTPVLVGRLCKLAPERLKPAFHNAAEGLHPRAQLVPDNTPPELLRWDHHLSRLRKLNNSLNQQDVLRPAPSLNNEEKKDIYRAATAIRANLSALLLAVRSFGGSHHLPPRGQVTAAGSRTYRNSR